MSEKEKGTNNSRFREIISVLRKHNITHGISPKKHPQDTLYTALP